MERKVDYSKIVMAGMYVFIGLILVSGSVLLLSFLFDVPLVVRFLNKIICVFGVVGVFGIKASITISGIEKTSYRLINGMLLLATLAIMSGLGEIIVRYALQDITTTQYSASYFSRHWANRHVKLNSLGFREKEVSPQKQNNQYRIVIIGDSFTFGQGIQEGKRFSNIIRDNMKDENKEFEVLNFGWVGVDTVRETRFLDMILEKYSPDYVLLQWFVNDVVDDQHIKNIPKRWTLSPSWTLHRYLNYKSGLYYLLNEQLHSLQMRLGLSKQYDDYFRVSWENPNSENSVKYKKALSLFIEKSRAANVPVGIVLFPKLLPDLGETYPFGYIHDLVLVVCHDKGVTCLDLRNSLAKYSQSNSFHNLHVNRFDAHPSELVNRIAAEKIDERFSAFWVNDVTRKMSR